MPLANDPQNIDTQIDRGVNILLRRLLSNNFAIIKNIMSTGKGVSDTFTTNDGKTITVENGIITEITTP